MNLEEIISEYNLINLFVELCRIPSPSLKEENLSRKILEIFKKHSITTEFDCYKNLIAKIPASQGCENIPGILLSAHMDVVGGTDEVNVRLSEDEKYLETDKIRTLGADNKAGVAAILDLAIAISLPDSNIIHGPVEITFTRDEEMGMSGVNNLDTSKLKSKYAVIADGERLGELNCEGASFTNVYVKVSGGKGGHSGINIHDKTRISAIKVLTELDSKIPQGVYKKTDRGVITSINAGVICGGSVNTYLAESFKEFKEKDIPENFSASNILDSVNKNSALNIISSEARSAYSVRSSDPENEEELLNIIKNLVEEANDKYCGLININLDIKKHLLPFVKNPDSFLTDIAIKAGLKAGLNIQPGSFHAGAETHVFANEKKNAFNEPFNPVIIGLANLENIHSPDEKIDCKSFIIGRKWLEEIVVSFAREAGRLN